GKFVFDASDRVKEQVREIIKTASEVLRQDGYRGIFGMDFLVDRDEKVYVIEINARTTGILPLLNEKPSDLPLYLLHILEVAGESYQITTDIPLPLAGSTSESEGPASFMPIFNIHDSDAYLDETITTGNFLFRDGNLHKLDDRARWN